MHCRTILLLCLALVTTVTSEDPISLETVAHLDPTCSNPPYQSCKFYLECAEARFRCGKKGYPVHYGNEYCTKFEKGQGRLSEAGNKWMWAVMKCLQDALAPTVVSDKGTTCKKLDRIAFDTHPYCYVRSGFCSLNLSDMLAVVEIIGWTAFIHIEAFKQVFYTGGMCGLYYVGLVSDAILPWSHDAAQIANKTIMHFSTKQLFKDMNVNE
ncbi:hypothetical protein BC936DRAFT_137275 [Jimgerdemannia flammicorona]|uniref:Chitin-binding type-2 domain-containing protein n=1 Tax=Jimgerdemannia flammicorona TaxID=994334 RepID=A0A433DJ36_9FUNG|nr:hypothetical protein BC936DRAFT_137275 [Jimgerdemannia flammicorona]